MNKNGYLTSFVFGFIGLFILILVLVCLLSVQEGGVSSENMTIVLDGVYNNIASNLTLNETNNVIVNVLHSFVHFVMYSSIEVTKAAIHYCDINPEYVNPKVLLYIIMISLMVPIIYALIKFLILVFLFIKEWIQTSKDKKKLKELKENN